MFNPFDKEFRDVRETDLERLKTVAEGWYVEYKAEKVSGKKIAKSISSFANSYGGIFFVGIVADPQNNCAFEIIGVKDSPDVIRDSLAKNVQPFPYIETFSIELKNGKHVLMTIVPEGGFPPYIHADGRIYRRRESASEPVAENNRHAVDELYKKAATQKAELENFRDMDLTFCEAEDDIPYIEMFVNTVPFKGFAIGDLISFDKMKATLEIYLRECVFTIGSDGGTISFNLGLDSVNTYHDSICLRAMKKINPAFNGLTILIDCFGGLKAYLPLNYRAYPFDGLGSDYKDVLQKLNIKDTTFLRIIFGRDVFASVCGLIAKHCEFLRENGYVGDIEIKYGLKNFYRTSLFFESENYYGYIEKYGIPVCMKDVQSFPMYPHQFSVNDMVDNHLVQMAAVLSPVYPALGVPYNAYLQPFTEDLISYANINPIT